ncbi:MAG TPA: hypothetical protein VFU36_13525 [Jatrophihabitans sp.]|nr:hypothetical protein [Jatrophihabitans sp.]
MDYLPEASMGLTGPGPLLVAALSALAVPAMAVPGWQRLGRPGPFGWLGRIGILAGCQLTAELPTAFGWLSRYVPAPLAPLPTVDGLSPQPIAPVPAQATGRTVSCG